MRMRQGRNDHGKKRQNEFPSFHLSDGGRGLFFWYQAEGSSQEEGERLQRLNLRDLHIWSPLLVAGEAPPQIPWRKRV